MSREIYRGKIDDHVMDDAFKAVASKHLDMTDQSWDCDIKTSYNLTDNILNVKELWPLKMSILNHINEYMFSKEKYFDGYIKKSWVNIYEENFYQEYHNHKDDCVKFICGVVYLTSSMSDIEFYIDEPRIRISPNTGDILLFDDDVLHRVLPNKSENKRISLAFNYQKCQQWRGLQ